MRIPFPARLRIMRSRSERECVLVVEGKSRTEIRKEQQAKWRRFRWRNIWRGIFRKECQKKEAMKQVAKDRGISKRDVYQALLSEEE